MINYLSLARPISHASMCGRCIVRHSEAFLGSLVLGALSLSLAGQSRDFVGYSNYFSTLRDYGVEVMQQSRFEPMFSVLSLIFVQLFSSDLSVYALFVGVAFYYKWLAVRKLSRSGWVFLTIGVFYLARFSPLHELTQIRIALALSLWLFAISQTKRFLFWPLLLIVPLTHYSALLLTPFTLAWYLLQRHPVRYMIFARYFWFGLVALVCTIYLLVNILINEIGDLFYTVKIYNTHGFGNDPVNLVNIPMLIDVAFLALSFALTRIMRSTPEQRFWLGMQFIGILYFYATSDFPVFAVRIHEMFSISLVLYLLFTVRLQSAKGLLSLMYLGVCSLMYIYLYFFSNNAIHSV